MGARVPHPLLPSLATIVARELYKFLDSRLVRSLVSEQLVDAAGARRLSEDRSEDADVSVPAGRTNLADGRRRGMYEVMLTLFVFLTKKLRRRNEIRHLWQAPRPFYDVLELFMTHNLNQMGCGPTHSSSPFPWVQLQNFGSSLRHRDEASPRLDLLFGRRLHLRGGGLSSGIGALPFSLDRCLVMRSTPHAGHAELVSGNSSEHFEHGLVAIGVVRAPVLQTGHLVGALPPPARIPANPHEHCSLISSLLHGCQGRWPDTLPRSSGQQTCGTRRNESHPEEPYRCTTRTSRTLRTG
jgi:hypothetical protein